MLRASSRAGPGPRWIDCVFALKRGVREREGCEEESKICHVSHQRKKAHIHTDKGRAAAAAAAEAASRSLGAWG